MLKDNSNITQNILVNEMIENIQDLAHECLPVKWEWRI